MGEPGTGKSCLIKRYCEGRYIPEYISTIGIDYGVKTIENEFGEVKVNFWDVAGDQVYFDIRNEFYKDTHGAILVYDVSNRSTFSALEKWHEELFSYCQNDCVVFLIANKTDLEPRTVSTKEGQLMADKMKFRYFETSAATGAGVQQMFDALFKKVLQMMQKPPSRGA